jgi:hypothetical protein
VAASWKRHGGRKLIIAPDHGDAWAPAKPRPDETLIRALARAHRWKRMLKNGIHSSINALAEAEKINRAYVCRLLNLTLLSPEIAESVLDGRQSKGVVLEEMVKAISSDWAEQRRAFVAMGGCMPTRNSGASPRPRRKVSQSPTPV